jgi:hypothetical protein
MPESTNVRKQRVRKYFVCQPTEGGYEFVDGASFGTWREAVAYRKRHGRNEFNEKLWVSGPIQEALRKAIRLRRETRYQIAKGAALGQKVLPRFLDQGTDIQLSTLEALAEYLGLELRPIDKE